MATCLSRKEPVPPSSQSSPSERVKAKTHCETMEMKRMIVEPKKILLVDDVVTRGSTFLGAACRVSEVYPEAEVKAFAPIRTVSRLRDFTGMETPEHGLIELCKDGHGTTL
ncbi:MAG: hypothetical protein OXP12_00380 [Thaumarchaeota archaeon]|nr:hypothetical protein [Nitrososphaerota archaeon]